MTNPMEQLLRHAIGYESLFRAQASNFPPHNIEQVSEDHYRLSLAVAGYSEDDLSLSLHKGVLTIVGQLPTTDYSKANFLYHGIALRDFKREFTLGANVEVVNASLVNGLLVIDLMREIPETEKPKTIRIS